jgi:GNAT superfamily N-acetyltransferase
VLTIAPATPSDLTDMVSLLGQLFAQEAEFSPDPAAQARGLQMILDAPDTGLLLIAREGPVAVGMVGLLFTFSTALGARVALLEDMVVTAGLRNAGAGSALLQEALRQARAAGCKRVTLLTDDINTAAQRFYARHGFVPSPMLPLRCLLD